MGHIQADAKAAPKRAGERIFEVASELFGRHGVRAVGVDEIVRRAGVTKPSLYRAFPSKDELAAAWLRAEEQVLWAGFEKAGEAHPTSPRDQVLAWLSELAAGAPRERGSCSLSNAALEFPEASHPVRRVAVSAKNELRRRLQALAAAMGAREPGPLGDGLLLLAEGALVGAQLFGEQGPSAALPAAAAALMEAHLASSATAPAPAPAADKPRPARRPAPRAPAEDLFQPELF